VFLKLLSVNILWIIKLNVGIGMGIKQSLDTECFFIRKAPPALIGYLTVYSGGILINRYLFVTNVIIENA